MLLEISIKNFAIIEEISLNFEKGMTVLTGETGAGKSIIIDAIGAVAGGADQPGLIRTGESLPWYRAVSKPPQPALVPGKWCGPDENGELVISRKIQGDGKNLCRVGGVPCTVLQLKAWGPTDRHSRPARRPAAPG